MLLLLCALSVLLSLSSKSVTHPVSFMSIVLTQTLAVCFMSTLLIWTPWFAFTLFLIFMGGVMVLFVYTSSLASNENFLWDQKEMILTLTLIIPVSAILVYDTPSWPILTNCKPLMFLAHIYSVKFSPFFLCLIAYLLLTLLIVSNAIKKNKSPIRSMK